MLERKENGYLVRVYKELGHEQFVYNTLEAALEKAAWELDYTWQGKIVNEKELTTGAAE